MPAWSGHFSCDNALSLWIGTEYEVFRELEAAKILASTSQTGPPMHYHWFGGIGEIRQGARIQDDAEPWEYLYLAAGSDGNAWQGLIGLIESTAKIATGDAGWQVYSAGQHSSLGVSLSASGPGPAKSELDAFIMDANTNGRWEVPHVGPHGGKGPWSSKALWMAAARWIWYRPDDFEPLAATPFRATDPSGVFSEPGTPSTRASEPLLFRLPLRLLGLEWMVDCCAVLSARLDKYEFFGSMHKSPVPWNAGLPIPGASAITTFTKWSDGVLTAPVDGLYRFELSGRRGVPAGQSAPTDELRLSLMRGGPSGFKPGQDQHVYTLTMGTAGGGTTSGGAVVSLRAGDTLYVSPETTGQTLGQLVDATWVVYSMCCEHTEVAPELSDLEVLCELIETHFETSASDDLCACVHESLVDRYGVDELSAKLASPGLTFLQALRQAIDSCT